MCLVAPCFDKKLEKYRIKDGDQFYIDLVIGTNELYQYYQETKEANLEKFRPKAVCVNALV